MFNNKMAEFQQNLSKTSSPASTSSLSAEFTAFKSFIVLALNTLQRQVEFLGKEIESQEMKRRRKMILFHGVPEEKSEDLTVKVAGLVADHLLLPNFSSASIKSSFRLGRSVGKKPRPILVKFREVSVRDKIWFTKTKFKGTGVTQSEFLTKNRHEVFLEARSRFGINKCWTRDGCINVLAPDGSHYKVECSSELNNIPGPSNVRPLQTKDTGGKIDKAANPRLRRVVKK